MHPVSHPLDDEVSPRIRGRLLKNLADFLTELARVHAGFVPSLTVWEQRKELPGLVFRTLRRVQDLRQRGRELGVSFSDLHQSGAAPAPALLHELCAAPSEADFLASALVIVPESLISAIETYLKRNDSVYDLPSRPLLETCRDELAAQRKWAAAAVEAMAAGGVTTDARWLDLVRIRARELEASLPDHAGSPAVAVRSGRRIGRLPFAGGALPRGFRHLEFGPEPLPPESSYAQRERFHAVNFLQEVQAADSCASMLFEAPDMPWAFYLDLSRHLWDESRHAMFGERKLAELGSSAAEAGLSTKAYSMRQTLTPLDRYAALATQEADAFPGKHAGLKDALAHGDNTSAMAWSYDIADETQHVRFGNTWIPVLIERTGEPRSMEQVKEDAVRWRATVLAEVYKPTAASFRP